MNTTLRKVIMLLPVVALTLVFAGMSHRQMRGLSDSKILLTLAINLLPLLLFAIVDVISHEQRNMLQLFARSSFYVYLFAVLKLTIYLIPVKRITAAYWKHHIAARISSHTGVNFTPFRMLRDYGHTWDPQIIGNLVMLLPLGIYIPLLYPKCRHFMIVLLIAVFTSAFIEGIQLFSDNRHTDIDDLMMNTAGAIAGYLIFKTGAFKAFRQR